MDKDTGKYRWTKIQVNTGKQRYMQILVSTELSCVHMHKDSLKSSALMSVNVHPFWCLSHRVYTFKSTVFLMIVNHFSELDTDFSHFCFSLEKLQMRKFSLYTIPITWRSSRCQSPCLKRKWKLSLRNTTTCTFTRYAVLHYAYKITCASQGKLELEQSIL